MRQLISGMVAAVAVMAASPAMAWCGYSSCSPCASYSPCATAYVAPAPTYSYGYGYGCGTGCGGWATQRLADPVQQYYYINQGPTYTGPGSYAPVPTYSEGGSYRVSPNYGYGYRSYRPRAYGYGYRPYRPYRSAYRYGHAPRYYGARHAAPYHYGHRVLRRYY
jgi:hypothetical protein